MHFLDNKSLIEHSNSNECFQNFCETLKMHSQMENDEKWIESCPEITGNRVKLETVLNVEYREKFSETI